MPLRHKPRATPTPQPGNQACALGERYEQGRLQLTPSRMPPPQQRLEAEDFQIVCPHEGLVDQRELLPLHRQTQVLFQEARHQARGLHAGLEQAPGVAAVLLGSVEREIGPAEQDAGIAPAGSDVGDAD